MRNHAQAEEVCQEILFELWLQRHQPGDDDDAPPCGGPVRSAQAAAEHDHTAAILTYHRPFDEVGDAVEARLEREQVRRCLATLTLLQRQAVLLAYYDGCTAGKPRNRRKPRRARSRPGCGTP